MKAYGHLLDATGMRGGDPPDDIKKKVISVAIFIICTSVQIPRVYTIAFDITIDAFRNSKTNLQYPSFNIKRTDVFKWKLRKNDRDSMENADSKSTFTMLPTSEIC